VKYAIVIPDGAADRPTALLGGRTVFDVARHPHMDRIASEGRLGTVRMVPPRMAPGSDVAILSLLGYNPATSYTGRAPLEAAARGIEVGPDDWVFRCNLVTVADEEMVDYSAGHITTKEAAVLMEALAKRLGTSTLEFHAGVGYRHLLVVRGEKFRVTTHPPHDIMGRRIKRHLPRGKNAARLKDLMAASREIFAAHPINQVRRDLGEMVAAVDLVRGIARLIGWDVLEVEGATGYYDTNYAAKGRAAVEALADHDLVLVHVEATDEAGHNGDAREKVRALEAVDREVVGPLLDALAAGGPDWRILVAPDHETPLDLRTHEAEPVPFAVMGKDFEGKRARAMPEADARRAGLHVEMGHTLMEYFLKR
jgi:2,3-bisphosphoglycerate-independent phosphoglycerate mutase